jgi:hypothetical protein
VAAQGFHCQPFDLRSSRVLVNGIPVTGKSIGNSTDSPYGNRVRLEGRAGVGGGGREGGERQVRGR